VLKAGILAGAAALSLLAGAAAAQTASGGGDGGGLLALTLPPVEVIATTPLPGSGIDVDKVPASVQTLTSSDLEREGTPSVINSLSDQAGSVNMNANLVDPFQPDVLFRGFEASPVLGTPEGLAVYQNGVRINEAFGDTVNWDLIPDVAIDRLDLVTGNPVYGLNALGGAVIVTMKNGFTYQGFESETAGGSFAQRSETMQYGKQVGNFATYIAARWYDEDGWRQFSPDHVRQLYADIAARGNKGSLDLSFTGADNYLSGEGTTPVQSLAVNRTLDFTTPQYNVNQLEFVTLNGSYNISDTLSLQANAYLRHFHQFVLNGNTTNYIACTTGNGLLCQPDGLTPLMSTNGTTIPDISDGGTIPIGEDDTETIDTLSVGGALQATYTGDLFRHPNHFVFGGSIDHSDTDFQSAAEVGVINSSLQVEPSGYFVDTPENTGFQATPVGLSATADYYGFFLTDTFDVNSALSITASGRFNLAEIGLLDHRGSNLTGNSSYRRFNPEIGATYKITPIVTAYAGYSEGNRAPTPSEIECSNPLQPCLLPSTLSSDPPGLKQVVSHTYEAGLRGNFKLPKFAPGSFNWHFGLFRTDLDNDIYGVATSISSGFFENIGSTQRQGIETSLAYKDEKWSAFLNYSFVLATFESPLTLPSPNNPFADANGNIHVVPGDILPGIPEHQVKLGVDYNVRPNWTVGGVLNVYSDQYLHGDESNQTAPLPGYAVVNLHSTYRVTRNFELFVDIQNVLNARYSTFGEYGDPTGVDAPGIPPGAVTNGPGVINRFYGPAAPISVFGGLRVRL
jgi:iron complex outermembrane recepter protein